MRRRFTDILFANSIGNDTEALIQFQFNRDDTARAETAMDNIVSAITTDGHGSLDKVTGSRVKDLSSILSEMVGFNVSLTYSAGSNFCTYIVPAKINDAMLNNVNDVSKYYEDTKSDGSTTLEYHKKSDTIDSMLSKSYEVLNGTLSTSGIKVDLEKGKIFGLGKDYTQIVMVDFAYVLDTYKLSSRECLACIMHEIGHTFMYYMQLDAVYANMTTLMDTVKGEYLGRNSTARETITIAYNKVTGNKKDIDNKSTEELIVDLGREIITSKNYIAYKESESQSDLFAARYGFGADLTTALQKMTEYSKDKGIIGNILAVTTIILSIAIYVYLLIISILFMSSVILLPLGYLLMLVSTTLFELVMGSDFATPSFGSSDFSRYDSYDYDSLYDRLGRIRQQIIASLKSSELDNSEIKIIISQLDGLSKLLTSLKHKRPILDKIAKLFGSKRIAKLDTHYLVESILNSDLVIASARIKTI